MSTATATVSAPSATAAAAPQGRGGRKPPYKSMSRLLKSINRTGFGELGSVVNARDGRWIIGGEGLFPMQLERLAEAGRYMLYATAVRATAEPIYVSLMKTMFIENLEGTGFGQYGICAGPVTITIYQGIVAGRAMTVDRLAGLIACHRMFMECYLEGGADLPDETPPAGMMAGREAMHIPFCH